MFKKLKNLWRKWTAIRVVGWGRVIKISEVPEWVAKRDNSGWKRQTPGYDVTILLNLGGSRDWYNVGDDRYVLQHMFMKTVDLPLSDYEVEVWLGRWSGKIKYLSIIVPSA